MCRWSVHIGDRCDAAKAMYLKVVMEALHASPWLADASMTSVTDVVFKSKASCLLSAYADASACLACSP